jgi:hypothetical protein
LSCHCFTVFVDTNIQPLFEFANFFKDIFQLFSNSLKIKEKKTAANSGFVLFAPLTFVVNLKLCARGKQTQSRKTL